ncbi:DNA topoisomerase [Clostridium sp. MT-14]|uniref:type IA DNA topoisomerase n=1 Tax=unclassified Clostridium TaxID=2614128 RepID=UPI00123A4588|nr:type IA DNA topoisomerase [Clostridium sp. HV4-5-A1G]KAA8668987.1 type IA DNA topoisomerase [Clostridium sp. HV4-5-A1G]CAB1249673.1 DNA topoisomerase III [Clostridiaceae bacterium BL-3]
MKQLVLAEKPNVAQKIAQALECKIKQNGYMEGEKYVITWASGHLLKLYDARDYEPEMARWDMDNFPFIPQKFRYKKIKSYEKQLSIIKRLVQRNDIENFIVATDADREGQLIGDTIIDFLKVNKPVYRVLRNEWTPEDVKKGFENPILNSEMKSLKDAAVCRQWSDWLIGINLTSVATLKYVAGKGVLNVGRVLMPTLKLVYDRDMVIKKFVPEKYFKLMAIFINENGERFSAVYFKDKQDKFKNEKELPEILSIVNRKGVIKNKKTTSKTENSPHLFNLSTLQGYITSKNPAWTSDKVLKTAQSLYEKSFITYPRTESMYLEESLVDKMRKVFELLKGSLDAKFDDSRRIFDSSKVSGHSALTPTYIVPENLTRDEKIVYNAIKNRFLMQFLKPARYEETRIIVCVEGLRGDFYVKGRIEVDKGWKILEYVNSKDSILPPLAVLDKVTMENAEIKENFTSPPFHHTEKSLIVLMMSCGKKVTRKNNESVLGDVLSGFKIGTAATRADTIEKLKSAGYITKKGRYLYISDLGRKMVENFPVKSLFNLNYTGHLEKILSDIEYNKIKKDQYLSLIYDFTREAVDLIKNAPDMVLKKGELSKILGKCPECGHDVIEGRKAFECSNWKAGCRFAIWKDDKYLASMGKKATKSIVKELLKNGKVRIRDLKSRKGILFDAYFMYIKSDDKENKYPYRWKMVLKK